MRKKNETQWSANEISRSRGGDLTFFLIAEGLLRTTLKRKRTKTTNNKRRNEKREKKEIAVDKALRQTML